jgi:uncharacterized protein (DUF305 family)
MSSTTRHPVRWIVGAAVAVGVVAVGVAFAVAGGDDDDAAGPRIIQPGAPGEDSRELSEDEAGAIELPPHVEADVQFMQDMIVHHGQALDMTALVADRSDRDDIALLARRIEESQLAEIDQMERWLSDRDEEAPAPGTTHGHDGALMPGMLTEEQFAELSAARGPVFDERFLELMIQHHGGALIMVEDLRAAGGGVEVEADALANHIHADQEIEIGRMREVLAAMPT